MDKETEAKIIYEVEQCVNYLFWRIRDVANEFPVKIRITSIYGKLNNQMHFMETERIITPDIMEAYEEEFQKFIKKEVIEQAKKITKND